MNAQIQDLYVSGSTYFPANADRIDLTLTLLYIEYRIVVQHQSMRAVQFIWPPLGCIDALNICCKYTNILLKLIQLETVLGLLVALRNLISYYIIMHDVLNWQTIYQHSECNLSGMVLLFHFRFDQLHYRNLLLYVSG